MARQAAVDRKPTQREELGIESRRKIIDAAGALMAERGFGGTSIAAVSKRSGLPSGSIYWHFDSKADLLAAAVEEGAQRWFDSLPRLDELPSDPVERVERVFETTAAALEERPQFLRLLLLIALERGDSDEVAFAAIQRVRALARERLNDIMRATLEPFDVPGRDELAAQFASLTLSIADGAFIAHHIEPDSTDIRGQFDMARRALIALARELLAEEDA